MSLLLAANQAPADRARVRQAVEEALARPEFHYEENELLERLAELRDEVLEWIGNALGGFAGSPLGELLGWLVILAVLGATLTVVWIAVNSLRKTARTASLKPHPASPRSSSDSLLPDRDLARARELAAAGRFEEAMHALYRGVLLWLDRGGLARFEEDKTGGEVARELEGSVRRGFRALLAAFYPIAFGGRAPSDASWSRMRAAASELGVPE